MGIDACSKDTKKLINESMKLINVDAASIETHEHIVKELAREKYTKQQLC